jgi:hypothetical protein
MRLPLAAGFATLGVLCLALGGSPGAHPAVAETGPATLIQLPGGAIAGSSGLALAGMVTLTYEEQAPSGFASAHTAERTTLPPLALDGDSSPMNSSAASIEPGAASIAFAPGAANSIQVKRVTPLCPGVQSGCTVGGDEPPVYSNAAPNVASSGNKIFEVFESFAARSVDNGQTWGYVNPYTAFPNGAAPEFAAGFWGRQRLAQDPSRGLIIWALQYGYAAGMEANGIRIAVAHAGSDLSTEPTQTWSYYDITGATLGIRAGKGIEVHQLQVSNGWAYLSVNIFDPATSSAVNGGIVRLSLAAMALGGSLSAGEVQFYNPPDAPYSARTFSMTPVNGATSTIYFGSVTGETSFRVLTWSDGSPTPAAITNITNLDATKDPGANLWDCGGPDLSNPCGVADSRVQTGWTTTAFGGEVGFLWNSDRRPAQGRPLPFVRGLVLRASDLSVKAQPDLFTNAGNAANFAWIYPSIAVNDRGHLAGTVTLTPGPGTTAAPQAPAMWGFLRDDLTTGANAASGWDTFEIAAGTHGPDLNDWGAWSGAVKHAEFGNTWLLAGHIMSGSGDDESTRPQNAWVMRERDDPEPASLHFVVQPPPLAASGVAMQPAIEVELRNAAGLRVMTSTASINLSIDVIPIGPALSCTSANPVDSVAGLATFSGCAVDMVAAGARLRATSGRLTALSTTFDVRNAGFDATCDGSVDPADALAVLRATAGLAGGVLPALPCSGDANGNGQLDVDDILRIRRAAAGL